MKTSLCLIGLFLATSLNAKALSLEQDATPEYVQAHPKRLSVNVNKGQHGSIDFTIVLTLEAPGYVLAHLEVPGNHHIPVKTDTPLITRKRSNSWSFTLPPESLPGSTFTLGVSAVAGSGSDAVPLPGTIDYRFKLQDFVPMKTSTPK